MPENCPRCQNEAANRERGARERREALAVAKLRGRLALKGKKPTRQEEQAAKQAANAQHDAEQRDKAIKAKDKQNRVPPSRRI